MLWAFLVHRQKEVIEAYDALDGELPFYETIPENCHAITLNYTHLDSTLWAIADQLRGAMDADDLRDSMLSLLFLRYLSNKYEATA